MHVYVMLDFTNQTEFVLHVDQDAPLAQMLLHALAVWYQPCQTITEPAIAQQTSSLQPVQSDIAKNVLIIAFLAQVLHLVIHALLDLQSSQTDHVYVQREIMLIKTL
jgi:hypothetical protein